MGRSIYRFSRKLLIGFILIIWCSLFFGYIFNFIPTGYVFPGGTHGYFISNWLNSLVGKVGTLFLLLISFSVILFFGFENAFNKCAAIVKNYFIQRRERKEERTRLQAEKEEKIREEAEKEAMKTEEEESEKESFSEETFTREEEENNIFEHQFDTPDTPILQDIAQPDFEINIKKEDEPFEKRTTIESDGEIEAGEDSGKDIELTIIADKLEEQLNRNLRPDEDYDPTLDLSNYRYPTLELLAEHSSGNPKVTAEE